MTHEEREALVERMAQRGCDRGDPSGVSTWSALSEVAKEEWRLDMRAALAVAEPVLRADEREACAGIADVRANGDNGSAEFAASRNNAHAQKYYQARRHGAEHIAAAIRARGDA